MKKGHITGVIIGVKIGALSKPCIMILHQMQYSDMIWKTIALPVLNECIHIVLTIMSYLIVIGACRYPGISIVFGPIGQVIHSWSQQVRLRILSFSC